MSVSITLNQEREVVNNKYRITNTITTSSGIEKEVFVKLDGTYYYDRVATVEDMLNLDTIPDTGAGYFRDYEFYREFQDVSTAIEFAAGIKERIDLLVEAYDSAVNDFVGTDTTTYTS